MKYFVLVVLLCAVALEATPYGYGGLGGGAMGVGRLGFGGMSRGHSGYAHGADYGGQEYNAGSSGMGSQEYHNVGAGNFHDRGYHHKKVTSINQAEESSGHDVGGSSAHDAGAQFGNGFNNYMNGASGYGNQYAQGEMDQESMYG